MTVFLGVDICFLWVGVKFLVSAVLSRSWENSDYGFLGREYFWVPFRYGLCGSHIKCVSWYWGLTGRNVAGLEVVLGLRGSIGWRKSWSALSLGRILREWRLLLCWGCDWGIYNGGQEGEKFTSWFSDWCWQRSQVESTSGYWWLIQKDGVREEGCILHRFYTVPRD